MKRKKTPSLTARERILQAASNIISERGYRGSTTKAIASQAGVAEVTLFRHFRSKKELFQEILKEYSSLRIFGDELRQSLTWDLRKDLINIAHIYYNMTEANTAAILTSMIESIRQPEIKRLVAAAPSRQRDFLSRYLDEQTERGACRKIADSGLAAQAFFAPFLEYSISRMIYPDRKRPHDEIIETFVDLFLEGIRPEN